MSVELVPSEFDPGAGLLRLTLLCRKVAREAAAQCGLSVDEMHCTMLLYLERVPNVRTLGELLGLKATRVSKVLRSLERKGYVSREMSRSDRRVEEVSLTADGLKAGKKLASIGNEMIKKYLGQLPVFEDTLLSQFVLGSD